MGGHVPALPQPAWVMRFAQIQRVFWRSRGGGSRLADSAWRFTVGPRAVGPISSKLWTHHENAFVHCRLYMHIWLLGASPPDSHWGSAPEPRWVLLSPKLYVLTLPPNPGYVTVLLTLTELWFIQQTIVNFKGLNKQSEYLFIFIYLFNLY